MRAGNRPPGKIASSYASYLPSSSFLSSNSPSPNSHPCQKISVIASVNDWSWKSIVYQSTIISKPWGRTYKVLKCLKPSLRTIYPAHKGAQVRRGGEGIQIWYLPATPHGRHVQDIQLCHKCTLLRYIICSWIFFNFLGRPRLVAAMSSSLSRISWMCVNYAKSKAA